MSEITISKEAFTGMVSIRLGDELTHQVLLLTPAETVQLRQQLNDYQVTGLDDPMSQRESAKMKALTLYNGHSLPTIRRAAFERQNDLLLHFDFEVHQRIKENGQIVSKVVGVL